MLRSIRIIVCAIVFLHPGNSHAEVGKPDLAGLSAEERAGVERACASFKAVLGPGAYDQCLRDQLATLSRNPTKPDLAGVPAEKRAGVERACVSFKAVLGPGAYYQCLRYQLAALSRNVTKPDLVGIPAEERAEVERACASFKAILGPGAYYQCLRDQLAALNQPIRELPRRESAEPPKARPPALQEPPASESKPHQPRAWPPWRNGLSGAPPIEASTEQLRPEDLFSKVARSVYVVVAVSARPRSLALGNVNQGSAVAVSQNLLVTNCHVVAEASEIVVSRDERIAEAVVEKADPSTDRCVLRVAAFSLTPIHGVRAYHSLKVGETVYTLGSPSGLAQTFANGMISGLRDSGGMKLIQTTAPISPGSSGGGLFDPKGNLIGVTTFMLKDSQALNFAVSADEFWH